MLSPTAIVCAFAYSAVCASRDCPAKVDYLVSFLLAPVLLFLPPPIISPVRPLSSPTDRFQRVIVLFNRDRAVLVLTPLYPVVVVLVSTGETGSG